MTPFFMSRVTTTTKTTARETSVMASGAARRLSCPLPRAVHRRTAGERLSRRVIRILRRRRRRRVRRESGSIDDLIYFHEPVEEEPSSSSTSNGRTGGGNFGDGCYGNCYGCGVELQISDASTAGYVSPQVYETKKKYKQLSQVLCSRCHELSNGKMIPGIADWGTNINSEVDSEKLVTPDALRQQLQVK